MRNELTQIAYIEQYLEGKLDAEVKAIFEKELSVQPELRESLEIQRALVERIEILALREAVQQVRSQRGGNGFYLGFIIFLICSAVCLFAYWKYTDHPAVITADGTESVTRKKSEGMLTAPSTYTVEPRKDVTSSVIHRAPKKDNTRVFASTKKVTSLPDTVQTNPIAPVIQPPVDTAALDESFRKNFTVPFAKYTFTTGSKQEITDKRSGSNITIPVNGLLYRNGKPVQGEVTLYYREFRDAADMAYSGIPMTYRKEKIDYDFNSAGMFELYAVKDKDTLTVKRGSFIKVDFQITQDVPGIAFYKLDKGKGSWTDIANIQANPVAIEKKDTLVVKMEPVIITDFEGKEVGEIGEFARMDGRQAFNYNKDRRNGSVLASGADAGHTYPLMVKGLLCAEFGVYNCDQAYRMSRIVSVKPMLKDAEGKKIERQGTLTLIDLNYNGSFSFDPKHGFSYNPKGKNVLLLFTNDRRVFGIGTEDLNQAVATDPKLASITMVELTQTVKNTNDLKKYLGLQK